MAYAVLGLWQAASLAALAVVVWWGWLVVRSAWGGLSVVRSVWRRRAAA